MATQNKGLNMLMTWKNFLMFYEQTTEQNYLTPVLFYKEEPA
jgi:hypothetical protein